MEEPGVVGKLQPVPKLGMRWCPPPCKTDSPHDEEFLSSVFVKINFDCGEHFLKYGKLINFGFP